MTWGNGLIRLVDFLNFSFRNALCDGGCSPFGLAILRSLFRSASHISRPAGSQYAVPSKLIFRSASIFLALRARNIAFTQNELFSFRIHISRPTGSQYAVHSKWNFSFRIDISRPAGSQCCDPSNEIFRSASHISRPAGSQYRMRLGKTKGPFVFHSTALAADWQ